MATSEHRNITFRGLGVEKSSVALARAAQGARGSPGRAPEPWGFGTEGWGWAWWDLRGHFQPQWCCGSIKKRRLSVR